MLDSLTQKLALALGPLGDDHDIDTWTRDERVNTVFGQLLKFRTFFACGEADRSSRLV